MIMIMMVMVVIRFDSDASDDAIGCTAGNTTSGDDNETTEQPRLNIITMDECTTSLLPSLLPASTLHHYQYYHHHVVVEAAVSSR